MGIALIGFGANLGAPAAKYESVVSRLRAQNNVDALAASDLFRTNPVGGPVDQPPFLNGAIRLATNLVPFELLKQLRAIETELGRVRSDYWGPREIDLDLLLYDQIRLSTEVLTLPHPRFHFRRFALAPVAQVDGSFLHPIFNMTVAKLLAGLDRTPRVIAIAGEHDSENVEVAEAIAKRADVPFVLPIDSSKKPVPQEFLTVMNDSGVGAIPPQLVFWLSKGKPSFDLPRGLQERLMATEFSTWVTLNVEDLEAAVVEGAAAVAAMRPFAAK